MRTSIKKTMLLAAVMLISTSTFSQRYDTIVYKGENHMIEKNTLNTLSSEKGLDTFFKIYPELKEYDYLFINAPYLYNSTYVVDKQGDVFLKSVVPNYKLFLSGTSKVVDKDGNSKEITVQDPRELAPSKETIIKRMEALSGEKADENGLIPASWLDTTLLTVCDEDFKGDFERQCKFTIKGGKIQDIEIIDEMILGDKIPATRYEHIRFKMQLKEALLKNETDSINALIDRFKEFSGVYQSAIRESIYSDLMFEGWDVMDDVKMYRYLAKEKMANSDYLFEDGAFYTVNSSFMADLEGYKKVFPNAQNWLNPIIPENELGFFNYDKPYSTEWKIINNTLYLTAVNVLESVGGDFAEQDEVLEAMSKFTGGKFLEKSSKDYKELEEGEQAIKASWVDGTYIIRGWDTETPKSDYLRIEPISKTKLTIKNGEIVSREEMPNDVENLYNVEAWKAELNND